MREATNGNQWKSVAIRCDLDVMYLALEVAGLPQVGDSLDVRLESLWSGPERVAFGGTQTRQTRWLGHMASRVRRHTEACSGIQ
jgi:hypothetical protein